jgi:exopolysaccharide biosynthesis polyprenyl glycosylphosphotransferase
MTFDHFDGVQPAAVNSTYVSSPLTGAAQPWPAAAHRRLRWPLVLTRIGIDAILVSLAFVLAYDARYEWQVLFNLAAPESYKPLLQFWPIQAALTGITLIVFWMRGVYAQPRGASWLDQMSKIAGGTLVSIAVLVLGLLFFMPVLPSRLLFPFVSLAMIGIFGIERFVIKRVRVLLWQRGIDVRRVVVVGSTHAGQRIMKEVLDQPGLGYKLIGYVEDADELKPWTVPLTGRRAPHHLGAVDEIDRVIAQHGVDEVVVALPAISHLRIMAVLEQCRGQRVAFRLVPDLFEVRFNEVEIDALNGIPLIGLKDVVLRGGNLWVKRTLDAILATAVLFVTLPIMGLVALAIKLERPHGPVLFKQVRSGRGGRPFLCYKFRSMHPDAEALKQDLLPYNEADGPIFKMRNDPRVTRVGRFLRRTSLDEMPQVFNILRGDMSWVGPRPPVPSEVESYSDWHRRRLEITPGLTGLWQVSGRSDLSFDEMVKLDLYYAENWSLLVDLRIILLTIPAVLRARGAY